MLTAVGCLLLGGTVGALVTRAQWQHRTQRWLVITAWCDIVNSYAPLTAMMKERPAGAVSILHQQLGDALSHYDREVAILGSDANTGCVVIDKARELSRRLDQKKATEQGARERDGVPAVHGPKRYESRI